jgi:hypothetical protein
MRALMKNYRVWVANRKVFLYPENWLDPEIRDKSIPKLLVILLIVAGVIFIIAHHRSKNV